MAGELRRHARGSAKPSYRSLFGTVKILKSEPLENGRFLRIYFQDGLIQNMVDSDNRSMSLYTYALEALSFAYRPGLRSALVLGIGAGMVPMRLAGRGVDVTAVDIDPASLRAATEVFGFDPGRVHASTSRRTHLPALMHATAIDVVIVDLFHGDGVPDYLVTRDFFHDLKRCLGPDGVAVFNTFRRSRVSARLRAFSDHAARRAAVYRAVSPRLWPGAAHQQLCRRQRRPLAPPARVTLDYVPEQHGETLWAMLAHPIALDRKLLAGGVIIPMRAMPRRSTRPPHSSSTGARRSRRFRKNSF